MSAIESYRKTDIQGQTYELSLHQSDKGKWSVECWKVPENPEDLDNWDMNWDVYGVVVGYKDGNPNLPIREPFTEETARAEFEKWRK